MVFKALDLRTLSFKPEEFAEYSMICSEELIESAIHVLIQFSMKTNIHDKLIEDFLFNISVMNSKEIHIARLKFIVLKFLVGND